MELTRTDHHPRTTTSAPSRTSRPALRRPARRWRPRGTGPETSPAPVPWVVMGPGLTLTRRDRIPGYAQRLADAGSSLWRLTIATGATAPASRDAGSRCASSGRSEAAVQHGRALEVVDADRIVVWGRQRRTTMIAHLGPGERASRASAVRSSHASASASAT